MIVPEAAATGSSPMVAMISTSSPTSTMRGARMNTPVIGSSSPASSTGASNERTWRPKPLRCATMSIAASGRWSGSPSTAEAASTISPAQVPNVGIPASQPRLQGLAQPLPVEQLVHGGGLAARDDQRVDAGQIGRRPHLDRVVADRRTAAQCSRNAPWSASTPIVAIPATSRACAGAGRRGSPPSCGRPSARRCCGRRRRSASRRGSWSSPRRSRGPASTGRPT